MLYFLYIFCSKHSETTSIYLTYHVIIVSDIVHTLNGNLIINHLFKFNGWITMHNNVFNCAYKQNFGTGVYCDVYEMSLRMGYYMLKRSHNSK